MKKKDLRPYIMRAVLLSATVFRLWLSYQQMMLIMPGSAPIDDDLYYNWANGIAAGRWLGEYNYLTLSKYPFFAVYLALIHKIGTPYLVANCVLHIGVAALCARRFSPVVKNKYLKAGLYLIMLYNPSTWAKYTLRVYRDSLFPILCTAFFVRLAGAVLRIKQGAKNYAPYAVISGFALGFARISREDGYWLLPFGIAASLIAVVYILTDKNLSKKAARIFALAVPYLITAVCVFTICSINYKYYNLFTITDFSSGSFAECYGNMTRLSHDEWNPIVAVPSDVRRRMYRECPSLEILKDELEPGGSVYKAFADKSLGDYKSGGFYWALRRAAQMNGIYKDARTASAYWSQLSAEVSAMCEKDENALPPRKSVTPPLRAEYIEPVCKTAFESVKFIFALKDMDCCETELSDITAPKLFEYMDFYNDDSNYRAIENSYLPYRTPLQNIAYKIMDSVTAVYRLMIIPAFAAAVLRWGVNVARFKKLTFERQITVFVIFGLIMMSVFRIFIISYMEVSAFGIGIYAMYLGAVYPLVMLTAFVGNTLWIKE